MQYEFLKHFPKRMKHVGMYGLLLQNSAQKQTWKSYGFLKIDEQLNFIFALLLYLMEQSLKEENCTMDDIGAFLDNLNVTYFQKNMSYEDCKKLGDFIINVILSNEGRAMYFDGYDFELRAYKIMNISYIGNKVVYVDSEIKRTSYYLTEDGYNLLLSTLEIENNMKLTIHEMIFKMHLEKQSYDKAVDEIKHVFNLLRIQLQKIQEAIFRVRRNALSYSVADYQVLLEENMNTIDITKQKFLTYRETVKKRAKELEEKNINVKKLSAEDEENLKHLKVIEYYLNRGIDEHQKILNAHFDLKLLYEKELELLAQMSLIQRFSFRNELDDKILENSALLEDLDLFFRPLFYRKQEKSYNLNKALELQKPIRKKKVEEETQVLDFDEDAWQEEVIRKQKEKLEKYHKSLSFLMDIFRKREQVTLEEIKEIALASEETLHTLVPKIEIFKEIMVELIKAKEIDFRMLAKEKGEYTVEKTYEFQLQEMLLGLAEEEQEENRISKIYILRKPGKECVVFEHLPDENGNFRTIRCSNIQFEIER